MTERPGISALIKLVELKSSSLDGHCGQEDPDPGCEINVPVSTQIKKTSSFLLPSTLRSCTCGRTEPPSCRAVWPTRRPRCLCTERSPHRSSWPTRPWWPMTPPKASSCRTPAQSIRGFSTARLWPEATRRSPPNTSCSMWRVGTRTRWAPRPHSGRNHSCRSEPRHCGRADKIRIWRWRFCNSLNIPKRESALWISHSSCRAALCEPGNVSRLGERRRRHERDLHRAGGAGGGRELHLVVSWTGEIHTQQ